MGRAFHSRGVIAPYMRCAAAKAKGGLWDMGTNNRDLPTRFAGLPARPQAVLAGIAVLLNIALSAEMQGRHGGFKMLLICPPPVREVGPSAGEIFGANACSAALHALYVALATAHGAGFLDAGQHIAVSPRVGIPFD
jgi:hypothetical protein